MGRGHSRGGFLEVDETVAEGAIRETLEETGLGGGPGELVGIYSRLEAAVVTLVFEARIVGGSAHPTPEALEVRAFGADEIPWDGIGFKTSGLVVATLGLAAAPGFRCRRAFRGREAF